MRACSGKAQVISVDAGITISQGNVVGITDELDDNILFAAEIFQCLPDLLEKIFQGMKPGAVLIISEKIVFPDEKLNQLFII